MTINANKQPFQIHTNMIPSHSKYSLAFKVSCCELNKHNMLAPPLEYVTHKYDPMPTDGEHIRKHRQDMWRQGNHDARGSARWPKVPGRPRKRQRQGPRPKQRTPGTEQRWFSLPAGCDRFRGRQHGRIRWNECGKGRFWRNGRMEYQCR